MEKLNLILLLVLTSLGLKAQEEINLDVVILVNEKIAVSNLHNLKVDVIKMNGEVASFDTYYHPGSFQLTAKKQDLFGEAIKCTVLKFDFFDSKKDEYKEYEIELKENWFFDYYSVIHIYDLKCRKYRKCFQPLSKNKNYTFEVDSPSYSFKRK